MPAHPATPARSDTPRLVALGLLVVIVLCLLPGCVNPVRDTRRRSDLERAALQSPVRAPDAKKDPAPAEILRPALEATWAGLSPGR